ncbi:MotA/TolQ/ExbB proton channel family protein [Cytobacillus sp. S13-E01]|uniref:MotA/TolQ/ExbB proton channel family protein n=1 Tax=Cytobacillus sp. S13-E01 TaxID=3031326 RepID=UPI0023D89F7B|nr:MotA/TolQ/ExbB proton channel family protein [Cytobacillus sp. S13-E01]MDF0728430.1 MotA/TolQ/ExbB proton channel family protein [Cytobacillus sp. S13-E01]
METSEFNLFGSIYIYFLIILACGYLINIFYKYRFFTNATKAVQNELNNETYQDLDSEQKAQQLNEWFEDQKTIPKVIKDSWSSFYKDFRQSKGIPDVYQYFLEEDLVTKQGFRKIAESIPATFVSLGILGTFIGITMGMEGLNPDGPSDELQGGIERLLGGMNVAFISSIVGILISLIIQFIDKLYFYRLIN